MSILCLLSGMAVGATAVAGSAEPQGAVLTVEAQRAAPTDSEFRVEPSGVAAIAEAFARQRGMLPPRLESSARLDRDRGEWSVYFRFAPYYISDTRELSYPWRLRGQVHADGSRCFDTDIHWPYGSSACPADQTLASLDRTAAIDVARSCATRLGLIPTPVRHEVDAQGDGTWLVRLLPGDYQFSGSPVVLVDSASVRPAAYAPVLVSVDQDGACSLVVDVPEKVIRYEFSRPLLKHLLPLDARKELMPADVLGPPVRSQEAGQR